jgi:hypothetical protein
MQKKIIIVPIITIIIVMVAFGFQPDQTGKKNESIFHVTLAEPRLYENGVYSNIFVIEKGEYNFRFVPNGDSPQNLTILLKGNNFEFSENFKLNGTLHESGFSEYYTWDYDGQKSFLISAQQEIFIQINPNGNVKGSVSVDIVGN